MRLPCSRLSLSAACYAISLLYLHPVYAGSSNSQLNGRIHPVEPLARPCFSSYNGQPVQPDHDLCLEVQQNYSVPKYRFSHAGAYMNLQDEICASEQENQCILDNLDPADPAAYTNRTCWQGSLPAYYIRASKVSDVQDALAWARDSGTPVSIKSSGHDYKGRSSGKGSLVIWTAGLDNLEYHDAFVPEGCEASASASAAGFQGAQVAITAGSGATTEAAYAFADDHNVTVLGGYATTISLSGGYVQGGGHSILSPVYGLAADRVLQFRVVTPDGVYRTANACQNQDLFWALRGGGGGTFGVVVEATHKVEPAVSFVAASIDFATNSTNLAPYYSILVDHALTWASQGWGGHMNGASVILVNPLITISDARDSVASVAEYAEAQGGSANLTEYTSFYSFFNDFVVVGAKGGGVGNIDIINDYFMSTEVFASADGRAQLVDFFTLYIAAGHTPYVPVIGPHLYNYTANSTSASPAWRDTLWQVGAGFSWPWNSTLAERQALVGTMKSEEAILKKLSGGATYSNEASPFTSDWQDAFWGENYAPLLAIKRKYDPDGVLSCWQCVGWEDELDKESCWSAFE